MVDSGHMAHEVLHPLIGRTFQNVRRVTRTCGEYRVTGDGIQFDDYAMLAHIQDCCEDVDVEDIVGDLSDLEGTPILVAERRTSDPSMDEMGQRRDESATWTFFELRTAKGSVTVRFYGSSNGYYGEEADLVVF